MAEVEVVVADLGDPSQQQAIVELLNAYSQEPIISGKPLPNEVQSRLIAGLQQHPTTSVLLAYLEDRPVGVAVCFLGFSTFAAKPLLNVHDLAVEAEYRGRGIGKQLLAAVEAQARRLGCCKLTLEVLYDNLQARATYRSVGFKPSSDNAQARQTLFLSKEIANS